jgi:hypothetical protein
MRTIWKYTATISSIVTVGLLVATKIYDPVMHVIFMGDFGIFLSVIFMITAVMCEIRLDFLKRIGYDGIMNRSQTKTIQIQIKNGGHPNVENHAKNNQNQQTI